MLAEVLNPEHIFPSAGACSRHACFWSRAKAHNRVRPISPVIRLVHLRQRRFACSASQERPEDRQGAPSLVDEIAAESDVQPSSPVCRQSFRSVSVPFCRFPLADKASLQHHAQGQRAEAFRFPAKWLSLLSSAGVAVTGYLTWVRVYTCSDLELALAEVQQAPQPLQCAGQILQHPCCMSVFWKLRQCAEQRLRHSLWFPSVSAG